MLGSGHERRRRGGIPVSPVDASQVHPAVDALASRLDPSQSRILLARTGGALAGWVVLSRDPSPLITHWGVVNHLQTQLAHRNEGIGSALMRRLREVARDEMGLEQLHLAVRGAAALGCPQPCPDRRQRATGSDGDYRLPRFQRPPPDPEQRGSLRPGDGRGRRTSRFG